MKYLYIHIALIITAFCCRLSVAEDISPLVSAKSPSLLPGTALFQTNKGSFEIAFFREQAPLTVGNFQQLAEKGFYNNMPFQVFEPGFILQTGDPTGTGNGGPGYDLPGEFSDIKHLQGTVSMARLRSKMNPERRSNGSQFFICLSKSPHLDGLYSAFARVIEGMDVVNSLRVGDKILKIKFPRP
jgi:peptidyl-prolyl cis-trans isomerase B (cyclophilin B)